jgi:cytochrome c-type biogenesis protein CcmH/NrfG
MKKLESATESQSMQSLANLLSNGDNDSAIELLRDHLMRRPDDPVVLIQLGELLRHTSDIVEGVEFLQHGLKIDPLSEVGWLSLASAMRSLSQNDGAKAAFRIVLELNENRVEALNDLGTILMDEGDWSSAIAMFQRATSLSPKALGVQINLAQALAQDGRTQEALATAQSALSSSQGRSIEAKNLVAELTRPIGAGEMANSLAGSHYNLKTIGSDDEPAGQA